MKNVLRPLALATELGITMGLITVATVLAGLFLGSWVDRQLGTRPLATLLFILVGVAAGWLGSINLAISTIRRLNAAGPQSASLRSALVLRDLGRVSTLVVGMLLMTFLLLGAALFLGSWLDRALGSRPVFMVALLVLAVVASLVGDYWFARRVARSAGDAS